jgi:hypothetical protein
MVDVTSGDVRRLREFTSARPLRATLSPDGRDIALDLPSRFNPRARAGLPKGVTNFHRRSK